MAYRGNISIAQDPRFHKSSFRKELESEFPQLKELSLFRVAHLAKEPIVERFVSKQITLVLEREDEVLTELVLESLRTNEKFEPYQVIETLEPFIGKPKALDVTKTIGDFLKNDPLATESNSLSLKAPSNNPKLNGNATIEPERPQGQSASNSVPSRRRERERSPERRRRRRDYDRYERYSDRHRREKDSGSSITGNKDERQNQDESESDSTQNSRSRERRYKRRTSRSRENRDSRRSRDHRRRTRHRSSSSDSSSSSSSSSRYSSKSSSSASSDKYGRQRQKRRDRRRSPS